MIAFPGTRRTAAGDRSPETAETVDRRTFAAAGRAQRESISSMIDGFVRHLRHGRLSESLSALTHLAPLALSAAPYLVALQAQHKDADLLEAASLRFLGQLPEGDRPGKRAWLTDSPAAIPWEEGEDLVVVTCGGGGEAPSGPAVHAFEPLLEIPLPGLPTLRIPPVLEMLDLCERERYAEILIDTPGPVGLAGLVAGKLLGIRLTAVQGTDLPAEIRRLSGSPALEDLARVYTDWFYGQMDRISIGVHTAEEMAEESRSRMTA